MKKELMKVARKLESLGLVEEAAVIKSATHLEDGYYGCSICETPYMGGTKGSRIEGGVHLCPVCNDEMSDAELIKRKMVAFEPFKRTYRTYDWNLD